MQAIELTTYIRFYSFDASTADVKLCKKVKKYSGFCTGSFHFPMRVFTQHRTECSTWNILKHLNDSNISVCIQYALFGELIRKTAEDFLSNLRHGGRRFARMLLWSPTLAQTTREE
jgi:hypothetical protein